MSPQSPEGTIAYLMHAHEWLFWIGFNVFVVMVLVLDLGVLHRRQRTIGFREAVLTSLGWILLAAAFAVGVWLWLGRSSGLQFVTGYLVEQSLSVDNLFVFLLIFRHFKVDPIHQHRVLFWGILGALVMRALFILVGVGLINRFHWIVYLFGAWLVYTGVKMALGRQEARHLEDSRLIRWVRGWLPMTPEYVGGQFFVRRQGLLATPLLVVLLVVESSDLLFAADSIPAVLAISRDSFIVYTSNVFAILGLRSLYFALAGMMDLFAYLNYGLSAVLVFIGVKMLVANFVDIPTWLALVVVACVLLVSMAVSLAFPPRENAHGKA